MGVAEATVVKLERTPRKCDCRGLAKTCATFDDPHLVSHAGLVPVMTLAERAGLDDLAREHVRISRPCGANAHLKVACPVAGMIAGAASIDDMGPPVRIGGDPEDVHEAAAGLHDEKAVQALECHCAVHMEDIPGA